MIKSFFTLLIIFSPSICFGMRKPSSSSTNVKDLTILHKAFEDKNIPLLLALAETDESPEKTSLALEMASKEVFYLPDADLTPQLGLNTQACQFILGRLKNKCSQKDINNALITAAHEQSYEKTKFLLEHYRDDFNQETLNQAIGAILTKTRRFLDDNNSYMLVQFPNPMFIYGNKKATENNIALIELLQQHGAEIPPAESAFALTGLMESSACSGSSKNRRETAKFFLSRGGRFVEECSLDCKISCGAPCVQLDLHRVGKPFTIGSALGFALGCIVCLPCNALATVRSCLPEETISLNLDTPPAAIRMDHQDSLEPALLTQQ